MSGSSTPFISLGSWSLTGWQFSLLLYIILALTSFSPVLYAAFKKLNLKDAQFSFEDSPHFSEEAKILLTQHYSRLLGTLVYWKNKAAMFGYFHHYSIAWTIVGGISLPFLTQAIGEDPWSKWTLTVISAHVALIFVAQKGFKVEQNFKNFRLGESEYYDIRRRLLDQPQRFGKSEKEQLDSYFSLVESVRHEMRIREVDGIASFDEIDQASRARLRDTAQLSSDDGKAERKQ